MLKKTKRKLTTTQEEIIRNCENLLDGKQNPPLSDDIHDDEHVMEMEANKIAAELFDATCRKENCHPDFVHSDNGEPMKGITLCAFYYHLGIINCAI